MSTPSKPFGKHTTFKVSKNVLYKGVAGIDAFIRENGLSCSEPPLVISSTNYTSNVVTLTNYRNIWKEFYKFCLLRGDYRSATLLDRDRCPAMPFPIQPSTICEYIDWKTEATDVPVLDYYTKNSLVDIFNNVIKGCDSWHAPNCILKFRAAMIALHDSYQNLRGEYSPVCVQCVQKHSDLKKDPKFIPGFYGSCDNHPGKPNLRPRGNPMESKETRTKMRMVNNKLADWKVKGNVQLLPGEIRNLRNYLVGSGTLENFQIYTMILLGIKLFLRADELLKIALEDFEKDYQIITDGKVIKALPLRIKGKFISVLVLVVLVPCSQNFTVWILTLLHFVLLDW